MNIRPAMPISSDPRARAGCAILLAMRFPAAGLARPRVQALLANLAAVAAVVTVEALLA